MAKLTDLEKVRRIRAHKRTRKNLLLLALAAILVFFSVSLVKRAEDVDFATLYSDLKVDLAIRLEFCHGNDKKSNHYIWISHGRRMRERIAVFTKVL